MSPPPPGLRRIVVTLDIEDDPLTELVAVQALLRLVEWLHHEGTTPARTTLKISGPDPTT